MGEISDNVKRVFDTIKEAELLSGRKEASVKLVAVTKYVDIHRIKEAVDAGITRIGENKAQEFSEKLDFFNSQKLDKNFIGQLQANKVKYVVGQVTLIQSVDRLSLAAEISRQCVIKGISQDILIEVNIGGEEQKGGIPKNALPELLDTVSALPNIRVMGLMCVPPFSGDPTPFFSEMRDIFERESEKKRENVFLSQLSMGMSGDYRSAILCGATMVRVGSGIFGARQYM